MGAAKGDPQDEEVPTPTKEATGEAAAEGDKLRYNILLFTFFNWSLKVFYKFYF